jgi:hypothetical protein
MIWGYSLVEIVTKARLGESAVGPVRNDCGPLAPLIVTSAIRPKRTKYLISSNGKLDDKRYVSVYLTPQVRHRRFNGWNAKYKLLSRVGISQRIIPYIAVSIETLGVFRVLYPRIWTRKTPSHRVVHSAIHMDAEALRPYHNPLKSSLDRYFIFN